MNTVPRLLALLLLGSAIGCGPKRPQFPGEVFDTAQIGWTKNQVRSELGMPDGMVDKPYKGDNEFMVKGVNFDDYYFEDGFSTVRYNQNDVVESVEQSDKEGMQVRHKTKPDSSNQQ